MATKLSAVTQKTGTNADDLLLLASTEDSGSSYASKAIKISTCSLVLRQVLTLDLSLALLFPLMHQLRLLCKSLRPHTRQRLLPVLLLLQPPLTRL